MASMAITDDDHGDHPEYWMSTQGRTRSRQPWTNLPTSRISGDGGNILDAANAHASTGESTESTLGTRAGGLGASTTSSAELDVESSDADLLAPDSSVLGGQHGGVRRRLVTISLDLHST